VTQQIERTIPEVDQNYPGFCCEGWDYEICLIFPDKNINHTSIWGACLNPNCPVHYVEPIEEDMYRGVTTHCLEDFEEILEEKDVKAA
jgi:hypothetical protein